MNTKREPKKDATKPSRRMGAKIKSNNPPDSQSLMRELQACQIKLEKQNEKLAHAQSALRKYEDMYDSSPVGHFTLARDGSIHKFNRTGANMLGLEHGKKTKRRFQAFVSPRSRKDFTAFLEKVFSANGEEETCEIEFRKDKAELYWSYIKAVYDDSQETYGIIVSDLTARKLVEETLRQVQANLEESQRISHLGSWVWDLASGKIQFSEEMFRLIGMVPDEVEVTREIFAKFLLPNNGDGVLEQFLQSTDSPFSGIEHQFVLSNGNTRTVYSRVKVYRDENGEPLRLLGSTQDITERMQAEAEIQLLAKLLGESPNPVLRVNADGVLLYINEVGLNLLPQWSLQVGELIPLKLREAVFQSMSAESVQTLDLPHGEQIFAFHIAPIAGSGYANLYGRDITDSLQMQALRESEERFLQIANNIQEAFWITDINKNEEIYISPAAEKIWGKPVDELMASPTAFAEMIHPKDQAVVREILLKQQSGENTEVEYRVQHPDGSIRWVRDRAFPIVDWDGKISRIAGITTDITERKQASDILRESNEKIADILAGINDAFFSLDDQLVVTYWNQMAEQVFHRRSEEMLGRNLFDVFPEMRESTFEINYTKVIKEKKMLTFEVYFDVVPYVNWYDVRVYPKKNGISVYFRSTTERKQAEEALQKSEERYRELFNTMTEGFALHELIFDESGKPYDYRFLDINRAFEQLTGLKREDIVGKGQREVLPDEDPFWFNTYCKVALSGESAHVEYSSLPLQRHYDVYAYRPAYNQFAVVFRDITERKLVEIALHESEENLNQAQRYAHVGSWVWNIKSNQLKWSDEMYHIFGIDKASFTGVLDDVIAQSIHPDDHDKVEQSNRSVSEQGKPIPLEYRIIHSDGSIHVVWGEAGELVLDEEGNPSLLSGIVQDVTERKQAEEEIRHHLNELQVLYENGLVIGSLLDIRKIGDRIIAVFEQYLSWHHVTIRLRKEDSDDLYLVAFNLPNLLTEEDRVKAERIFSTNITKVGQGLSGWAIQTGQPIRTGNVHLYEQYMDVNQGNIQSGVYMPLKIGERITGVISVESEEVDAFTEQDERLLATLGNQAAVAFENARLYWIAQQEISQRKQMENLLADERNLLAQRVEERTADLSRVNSDLEHALRVRDEFLASMSHELRTPLTGILGLSEVLQLGIYGELSDKQQKALSTIEESGRHLLDLINDILDLSRIEAGNLELRLVPCSIEDICQASLHLAKGMANKRKQNMNYSPAGKPLFVLADARRFKQILVNLLSNAIKFTPESGELGLEVQANDSDGIVRLTVWDKGIGIKPEDFGKLFKPFVQIDGTLAREYSGTGLGLSLVQNLTELHNGGIEFESVFGKGSRFTVVLPLIPPNNALISITPTQDINQLPNLAAPFAQFKTPLIMLADDNEISLQMIADYLEAKQARVMKVRSGAELLEKVSDFHPDIMLVDIQMPGMDGLETIHRIRSHPDPQVAATPVIAVTALAMVGDRELCLSAGANEYMSKPVRINELTAAIQRFLEDKQ